MRKLTQGWKIFFASSTVVLLALVVTLAWPHIEDTIWGKHADSYVFLIGQEHSYTIDQLKELAPIRARIGLVPVRFPEGVSSVSEPWIPVKLFDWSYPEGTKLYTIVAHNRGDGIDRNIKIKVDFTPNLIKSVKINHKERVSLIEGGESGSFAVLKINELLPDERQDIELLIGGKDIKSVEAWSENLQNIKKVFILDLVIEPDRDFAK